MPTYADAGVGPSHNEAAPSPSTSPAVATITAPCPSAAEIAEYLERKEEVRTAMADFGSRFFDLKSETGNGAQLVGLLNQGATCYMNSLLQALFMTPIFRERLFAWRRSSGNDGGGEEGEEALSASRSIPLELQRLFASLLLSSQSAVSTKNLTTAFGKDFHR